MNMKEEIENAFDELEIKVENACGEMDQISSDIKRFEVLLQSSPFSSYVFVIKKNEDGSASLTIEWCSESRRIVCYANGQESPLIEKPASIRREVHPYLAALAKVIQ